MGYLLVILDTLTHEEKVITSFNAVIIPFMIFFVSHFSAVYL